MKFIPVQLSRKSTQCTTLCSKKNHTNVQMDADKHMVKYRTHS